MKPEYIASFATATLLHALLLFGFRFGTQARPLPLMDAMDVNLIEAAPEPVEAPPPSSVPESTPEPTPEPPPPPEPAPAMQEEPATTPAPEPKREKPRTLPALVPKKLPAAVTQSNVGTPVATRPGPPLIAHPRYRSNPKPEYPMEARRLRQEGTVLVSVEVSAQGDALSVSLRRSSGVPTLDQAALQAVRRWTFEPARAGGLPIQSRVDVPVRFSLADSF